ncbi:uncharacterized protein LOC106468518 [Limulus polyphemus]|uniref:Uncharacterized protein LOC106468518 n=1 Tax=Limulus polyphemus TaxID=6850 RepID=A0ABM1T9K4_LIMPO|nr:uncharacterized protein LOC106468518 [Limulus polyphemus]
MSDKGGSISKVVQKHAGRAKERLLQNLGKADKTTDDLFEIYVHNFKKQQNGAHKLNKELKNYIFCVRAMQAASKGLLDTLSETYEQEWVGYEQIPVKAQSLELLVEDFCVKLTDQVSAPLNSYMNQFPDIRSKIAKRNRKMVDYDSSRHNLEALLHSGKKRDEMKIGKAREHLDEAKRSYEVLNKELHDDLPSLYDSRIPFLVTNLQSFFAAEAVFHGECTKVYTQLSDLMERLGMENQKGSYKSRNSWKIHTTKKLLLFFQGTFAIVLWNQLCGQQFIGHYSGFSLTCNSRENASIGGAPYITSRNGGNSTVTSTTSSFPPTTHSYNVYPYGSMFISNIPSGTSTHTSQSPEFMSSLPIPSSVSGMPLCVLAPSGSATPISQSPLPQFTGGAVAPPFPNFHPQTPPSQNGSQGTSVPFMGYTVLSPRPQIHPPNPTNLTPNTSSLSNCAGFGPNFMSNFASFHPGFPVGGNVTNSTPHPQGVLSFQYSTPVPSVSKRHTNIVLGKPMEASGREQSGRNLGLPLHHQFNPLMLRSAQPMLYIQLTEHSCSDVPVGSKTNFFPAAIMALPHKATYDEEYEPIGIESDIDGDPVRPITSKKLEELYDIPVGATTVDLPPGVFYRVRATHKYIAEDGDELDFEPGEIIQVVEYDDPEEQEEGWLMGVKESTNEKGLFPANFSRPI